MVGNAEVRKGMGITKCLQARATTTHDGTRKNKRTMPDKLQKLQKKQINQHAPSLVSMGVHN